MGKTGILLLSLLWCSFFSRAQYVNTDSLVVVPGFSAPLSLARFDSLEVNSPELLGLTGSVAFGKDVPAGNIFAGFSAPANGKIISRFGLRSGRIHTGTDIKLDKGDTVYAAFNGAITRAHYYHGYGNMVVISHGNNLETCYAHLSAFLVEDDDFVQKGEPLGLAGRTGRATTEHLHFEIRENERPYDPELVFDFENDRVHKKAIHTETLANLNRNLKTAGYAGNSAAPQVYKVQQGDSLWKISRRFRTSMNLLCQLNNLTESSVLQVGQALQIY